MTIAMINNDYDDVSCENDDDGFEVMMVIVTTIKMTILMMMMMMMIIMAITTLLVMITGNDNDNKVLMIIMMRSGSGMIKVTKVSLSKFSRTCFGKCFLKKKPTVLLRICKQSIGYCASTKPFRMSLMFAFR